jgi:hypothetical protein
VFYTDDIPNWIVYEHYKVHPLIIHVQVRQGQKVIILVASCRVMVLSGARRDFRD